ncbi:MAG: ArsR family transcriptional regulator [archaeon]|nr:ArsR family transcriptional regulator [archaeon]
MAKSKTREITLVDEEGAFNTFFKRFTGESADYDFEGVEALRRLLSNEKAKLLHVIKTKKPNSIYSLAKTVKRDFKSVFEDIKLLERFGFIEMIAEKTGKRERLRPILVADTIHINIKI